MGVHNGKLAAGSTMLGLTTLATTSGASEQLEQLSALADAAPHGSTLGDVVRLMAAIGTVLGGATALVREVREWRQTRKRAATLKDAAKAAEKL